jgi:cell division protein FtsI/penicillin-binding protein 2
MDLEYARLDKRTVLIFVGSVIFLTFGYLYLSHIQSLRGSFVTLKKQYNSVDSRQLCLSRGQKFLLSCFKSDFYEVTRNSNPYTRTYLAELLLDIYQRDLVIAQNDKEKAMVTLEFIEQSYAFLLLVQSFKIDRRNLQAGAILLAKKRAGYIRSVLIELGQAIQASESNNSFFKTFSEVEKRHLELVKMRYIKLKEALDKI